MKELTKTSVITLEEKEEQLIFSQIFDEHNKDYHYLAFDRQLTGFGTLGTFLLHDKDVREKEYEIMASLFEKGEVCSLYPRLNLTLYPTKIISDDKVEYEIDLVNINKHFADILHLNDELYKTKYLFVDFGHGASNYDEELLYRYLRELLNKSRILEKIYIDR